MSQREHVHPPYLGVCVGGPYAGKRLGSYDREQIITIRPRVSVVPFDPRAVDEVVEYKRGAYRWADNEWHWHGPSVDEL